MGREECSGLRPKTTTSLTDWAGFTQEEGARAPEKGALADFGKPGWSYPGG